MRTTDLIRMALRNLLARRWRSVFNLTGIVIGCVVVILTFAATRGIADGLYALLDSSDAMKLAHLWPTYDVSMDIPEEVGNVVGEMEESRREAIRKRLKSDWENEHFEQKLLDPEFTNELRRNPHVVELVPNGRLAVEAEIEGAIDWFSCEGVTQLDKSLARRIMIGAIPGPDDDNQILISEYAAYKLGFRTAAAAKNLLGRKLQVKFREEESSHSALLYLLSQGSASLSLSEQIELLQSVKDLTGKLDETSLPPEQIELLQRGLSPLFEKSRDENPIIDEFVICGIVRLPDEYTPSFLPTIRGESNADLAVHYRVLDKMAEKAGRSMYEHGAFVRVDHLASLTEVEAQVKTLGGNFHSASWLIRQIDEQISVARWGVAAVGIFVLCIAAFSISNTMVISVLERTAELGIMKSLGARDSQVVGMMLWEGGVMGAVGASVSIAVAFVLSMTLEFFVRKYVSFRIGEPYSGSVFAYSWTDLIAVFAVATAVCIIASILPARRASRLAPINAMRSS